MAANITLEWTQMDLPAKWMFQHSKEYKWITAFLFNFFTENSSFSENNTQQTLNCSFLNSEILADGVALFWKLSSSTQWQFFFAVLCLKLNSLSLFFFSSVQTLLPACPHQIKMPVLTSPAVAWLRGRTRPGSTTHFFPALPPHASVWPRKKSHIWRRQQGSS